MSLNEHQKKFIKENPRFTNKYLAELFGVGATQVLTYRRKLNGLKTVRLGRNSSDRYYQMHDFAIEQGFKNITEAFSKLGKRNFEQQFEKERLKSA